jgi:lipopolysaccharide/colanic/teichoic acid biosynthesis glycosyltransferase
VLNRVLGIAAFVTTSPAIAVLAVVVRLVDGRPVIFEQERAGQDGKPFRVHKFRTMRAARSAEEPDEARITGLGRFLRGSSLDELPSLWNVARGEMNLVGPRPLPTAYTALYSAAQARRLEVKPGLTGLLQVRGRNSLSWNEKFALDTWYVEHRSWRLDLRILLETPVAVLWGRGVSHPGHVTMPAFTGAAVDSEPKAPGRSAT